MVSSTYTFTSKINTQNILTSKPIIYYTYNRRMRKTTIMYTCTNKEKILNDRNFILLRRRNTKFNFIKLNKYDYNVLLRKIMSY